jgi:hypothetical protein
MKFVGALFVFYGVIVAIIYMGLHFNNGWVVAGGVFALLGHSIKVDDDKGKKCQ